MALVIYLGWFDHTSLIYCQTHSMTTLATIGAILFFVLGCTTIAWVSYSNTVHANPKTGQTGPPAKTIFGWSIPNIPNDGGGIAMIVAWVFFAISFLSVYAGGPNC